jgi:hypothetical protein
MIKVNRAMVLAVVLHECENLSVTLKEEEAEVFYSSGTVEYI